MTTMIAEIYEAFKEAGASDEKAKAAAAALSERDVRFDRIEESLAELKADMVRLEGKFSSLEERTKGRFTLLQWMVGFNLALTVAVLWMLIRS